MRFFRFAIAVTVLLLIYLAAWPVPVKPVAWQPEHNLGYVGDFEVNSRLEKFEAISMGEFSGPEAAIFAQNGDIIATTHEGWLVRIEPGDKKATPWVDVGGRPLGLDVDSKGTIWVANAYLGLQKVTPSGEVSLELARVGESSIDSSIDYADDVAIASNGKIYFSDATTRFGAKQWGGTLPASILDIVEHGDTGRVIEFDPVTRQARVVLTGLTFANGVAADPNGQFILVNETGEYRVWKLWIDGEKKGQSEIVVSNLPGFPDNISAGNDGLFWLGLMAPRSSQVDALSDNPFWRKVLMRLPAFLRPQAEAYGMVVAINSNGKVIHNLQAPSGQLYTTTGALENDSELFITSLTAPFLAKVSKVNAGLSKRDL